MTVQEAIKELQVGYLGDTEEIVQAKHMGIKALEEVEQYRALGTVEELKEAREKQKTRREWYQQGYQDGLNSDKWIPCEERLPEEMCRCLVTTKDGKVTETIYDKPFDRFVLCEDAIAWQPLPQPYKKEGA